MGPTVLGYADRLSVAPGEAMTFRVSVLGGARRYRAALVRLICGDTGPKGPGLKEEHVPTDLDGEHEGFEQVTDSGSYAIVDLPPDLRALESFTLEARLLPTRPGKGMQVVLGTWDEAAGAGFALVLDETGALALLRGDGSGGRELVSTGRPLRAGRWHRVAASYDAATGRVAVHAAPLPAPLFSPDRPAGIERQGDVGPTPPAAALLIGAAFNGTQRGRRRTALHFNGRIEAPAIHGAALPLTELAADAAGAGLDACSPSLLAHWDFSREIATDRVVDRGPRALHGVTVNAPKRAVTGSRWDGSVMDWRQAAEHYAAIHFHDDDLYDALWEPSLRLQLPNDLRSGVYALKLEGEGPAFYVGFFVRPRPGAATAKVAFLASTATYLAYANYRRRMVPGPAELVFGCLHEVDTTDLVLAHHPELGASTYDLHSDGSGVGHASTRRPLFNMRPTGRFWNFSLDLCLIDWLESHGIAYDVVTDDDLHAEGEALLRPYRAVLTGCHPEYTSKEMLDGLAAYLENGGRLMYMGGNGFYWRVSWSAAQPGLMELRRAEDGTRAWVADPGEYHHASTGEYGGLWRRQGRAPNRLAGIGFVAQGFDASSYYRRTAAAEDPRVRFIFEGVEEEIIGDFGAAGGGAAGLELDAADRSLGTPPHALVVARSENHSNAFRLVNEEQTSSGAGASGPFATSVRADMTFFETPNGGAVFSTGSISYLGSLGHAGYVNPVSRLTLNVLRRFIDPAPFAMPEAAPGDVIARA
jgi:N,N-dimethylformamidase